MERECSDFIPLAANDDDFKVSPVLDIANANGQGLGNSTAGIEEKRQYRFGRDPLHRR